MNRKRLILLSSILLFAACNKDEIAVVKPVVEQSEVITEAGALRGELYVKLANKLALEVEPTASKGKLYTRSMDLNMSFDEIGAKSFERVFPFAGEFEDRTRKAGLHLWYKVSFDESVDLATASRNLMAVSGVSSIAPVVAKKTAAIPFNDPMASQQWHYENTSLEWADINVVPVWEKYTTGDSRVIVAVVDSGVELEHGDLLANAIQPGPEGSKCFLYGSTGYTIYPDGHGTHVAGTIAAVNNNNLGVCGIAGGDYANGKGGARIMSCQIMHEQGGKTLQGDDAAAIKWAADHGAIICNNSWGLDYKDKDGKFDPEAAKKGYEYFVRPNVGYYAHPLKDAIDYFNTYAGCDADGNQTGLMKGGLVLFAAGNETSQYAAPACYGGAIAVGSISQMGVRSSFSNYGDWVDIAAPGGEASNILSTVTGNSYAKYSGTSMACPHVAGVAALVVAACGGPGFTREDLIAKLIGGANNKDLDASFAIGPLVDALAAVEYDLDVAAPVVTDFETEVISNTLNLSITVPACSVETMNVYGFNVLASKVPGDWSAAKTEFFRNQGKSAGESLPLSLKGLDFDTNYYVAVESVNAKGVASAKSASVQITTGSNHAPEFSSNYKGDYIVPSWTRLSFPFHVSDPDGHSIELSYIPGGDGEELVKISDFDYELYVDGTATTSETHTATFTADDGFGLVTEYEIVYTVKPNSAPVLKKEIEDIIIPGKGKSVTLKMSEYFYDADGETLSLKTETSGSFKVVEVSTSGDKVTVKAVAESGTTTISVKASDSRNESVKASFNVLVRDEGEVVSAYPNPVVDILSVATGLTMAPARIRLVSPSGNAVIDKTIECSAFEPAQINMVDVAPGRYTLFVEYEGQSSSRTIIKQ